MTSFTDNLKVKVQYFLPKTFLSRTVGALASQPLGKFTTFLIDMFIKHYQIDMKEAKIQDTTKFKTFNEFFTRELKKGARTIISEPKSLAMPVDGAVSQLGDIYKDAMLQAKGHYYSLEKLLGGNPNDTKSFENGTFITIYLSPKDYHRVHMPYTGKLEKMVFVPGDLFSVNPLTANNVDNLFARNERVICFFNNDTLGRFAVVLVGATIVASIATVFAGTVAPKCGKEITIYDYTKDNIVIEKGQELGKFMLGSTVICVFENKKVKLAKGLKPETIVKMGTQMGESSK